MKRELIVKDTCKVVNVMHFVRRIDERLENSTARLLAFTAEELRQVKEYGVPHTFLLQYDAVCDEDFAALFKNEATDKTELGLWYEIVEPLTTACGMPYRSERGWKWDWHIVPGFSMAYTPREREVLIDEAMRKFKATFGFYPKTVASWLLDTHTVNYLAANYEISCFAICRDQTNTDAYTLMGGYFNGAYYPSKNNLFTPAQSAAYQVNVPILRLLGPSPIHNYDKYKYCSEKMIERWDGSGCFTLEACCIMGSEADAAGWLLHTLYDGESLGFAYAQIGQENSFLERRDRILSGMTLQIDTLLARGDVAFLTMGDTGELFKSRYPEATPATALTALDNFDEMDVQSVYYDCKRYTANLFRFEEKLFLRSLFLFDERIEEHYLRDTCKTFDAVYENMPLIDTLPLSKETRKACGLVIGEDGLPFTVEKAGEGVLRAVSGEKTVTFFEDRIEIAADTLFWYESNPAITVTSDADGLAFTYKTHAYRLDVAGATIENREGGFALAATDGVITLYPKTV